MTEQTVMKMTRDEFFDYITVKNTRPVFFMVVDVGQKDNAKPTVSFNMVTLNEDNIHFNLPTKQIAIEKLFEIIDEKANIIDDGTPPTIKIASTCRRGFGNTNIDDTYMAYLGHTSIDQGIKVICNDDGEYAIVSIEDCDEAHCGIDGYFVKL